MSRSGVEAMKTRSPNGDMVTGIGLTSACRGSLSMINSMLSPCPGAGARRSLGGAVSLPLSGAIGDSSELACGSPPDAPSSAGDGLDCGATCGGRTAFLAPVTAIPLLLNPTTSTGIGTNEVRINASSVRPWLIAPDETDSRGAHAFDLKCLAIGTDYADFLSSWGALTSVTSVDFILYTGSPSSVCSPSIRDIVIITGLMRSTVPSAKRYSLHTSLDSNTSTSFGACPVSNAPSLTYFLTGLGLGTRRHRSPGGGAVASTAYGNDFRANPSLGLGCDWAVTQCQAPSGAKFTVRAVCLSGS